MKTTSKAVVGYWHYGVILTYASVVSAIIGICFSAMGRPGIGVICLLVSGLCDAFDGMVASTRKNRTDEERIFGGQIDSLSDIIAFGVAPVMIGFGLGMHQWFFYPAFALFVLCALVRLAYYNVTEEIMEIEGSQKKRTSFEGLPVTNVAVGLPVFYIVATMFHVPLVTKLIMLGFYLLASALFVIRFRMPKLRAKGLIVTILVLLLLLTALMLIRHFVCGVRGL